MDPENCTGYLALVFCILCFWSSLYDVNVSFRSSDSCALFNVTYREKEKEHFNHILSLWTDGSAGFFALLLLMEM